MIQESYLFLESFMHTHTPSGFESQGQLLWKEHTRQFADKVYSDVHGNMIACVNADAPTRIMLAGHCDEIGLMVTHISDEGFIHFTAIGGVDASVLPGMQIVFLTPDTIRGVIGKKPIHMTDKDARGKVIEIKDLMIDIGSKGKEETEKYIKIGTPACVLSNFLPLLNDFIASKAWDDKVGSFVVAEALRLVALEKKRLKVGVFAVSTVQEEIGSRGAQTSSYGIRPHAGIAVDVGFATDVPGDEKKVYGNVALGKGPILHRGANCNIPLTGMLETSAKNRNINVQWCAEPNASSTDADVLQITRSGVAATLVSIPSRYMHTPVEMCSLSDIENAAALIADTLLEMPEQPDFLPY
jgi:endoglucanase